MDGPRTEGANTRLRLRVSPGAARAGVVGRHGTGWKVRVTAAPERGKANRDVLELLADALELPRTALELVSGHGGRDKVVGVRGLSEADAEHRLAAAVDSAR